MTQPSNPAKVILVTGGAGYIGSRLIRDLSTDPRYSDYVIRIYDNLRRHHFCGLMDLPDTGRYELIEGDILDRISLQRAMQNVQMIVHLAAIVTTPLSFDHPEATEQVNHWGTATVVDAALACGVQRFLHASSASVCGPGGPFRETDECHPIGPYAISKLKAEKEVLRGAESGLQCTVVRLGTVFGNAPAMRFDAIANRFAYLAGAGLPLAIYGTGHQVRPLIHVDDASAVLRLCLAYDQSNGEIFHAATLHPSALEVADLIQELVPHVTRRYTDQHALMEVSFHVNCDKLNQLGFRAAVDLKTGLQRIIERWKGFCSNRSEFAASLAELD